MTPLLDARLRAVTVLSPVALRVADGSGSGAGSGDICIRFKTVGEQWRCVMLSHVGLLEAWFDGDVEIDGDLARQCDKVVSIGVLEHAGRDQIDAVVQAHADSLAPGGSGRRTPATYPMSRAFLYQDPPIRRARPELRHVA